MKLYHGTTESVARAALEDGLSPRDDTGVPSVWKDHPTRGDMVYLTDAYGLYFALCALKDGEKAGIVEVDTDLMEADLFYPDEDFLEQAARSRKDLCPLSDMGSRTKWYRDNLESFQSNWDLSLKSLGTCAYFGQIVPAEVSRVAIFDLHKSPTITAMALDPVISVMNYKFMGAKYRALMGWIFGDMVRLGDFDPFFGTLQFPAGAEEIAQGIKEREKQLEEVLSKRSAIEILEGTPA